MQTKFLAIVWFLNSNDLNQGRAKLIEHGFDVNDYTEDYGLAACAPSDLDVDSFFEWVQYIVEPVDGDVMLARGWRHAGALRDVPTDRYLRLR